MTRKVTSDVWWKNAVVYCLDVETFLDTDGDGCGDLVGLTERLDYLAGLGVGCVWLMPFMPSRQRDDGYDIVDFYGVDPRLGTHGDLVEMVRTANDRGMRVIADLVVNHTSDHHPWFREARKGAGSRHHEYYVWRDEKPDEKPGDVVFPDQEESNWAFDEEAGRWYLHRFYSHQPDLNVSNPDVRDEIAQIAGYWLEQGISGFRVDAVPFLIEPVGLPDGAIPDPHELLRDVRSFIGRRRGDSVLLGEVNLPPDDQRKFFGDEGGDELQLLFSFTVNQAMYLALAREQAAPLARALEALPPIPADCQWANFVRNHDELTLDKLSDAEREEVFAAFGPDEELQLYGRGLRRRLPPMLEGDQRRIRMVYSLMFSLPGTPVLFYGEEIGMAENLDIEGRYSVRAPMQWSNEPRGGFTESEEPCRPVVEDDRFGFRRVNVAAQRRDPDSMLNWMERLVRRRRECPELGWGDWQLLRPGDEAVFAHRVDWSGQTVVAVHNLADREAQAELELGEDGALVDLFQERSHTLDDGAVTLSLDPYDARWFRLRRPGLRLPP
ncbi:MAG: alpha amylase catalytic region [Solirubrobacterales bacterium]|nr:alpha amylase catalytic region [Solirubrobacterales bacterium]